LLEVSYIQRFWVADYFRLLCLVAANGDFARGTFCSTAMDLMKQSS
jgi:hypothetical protein